MKVHWKWCIAAPVLAALLLAGCHKINGGGWFYGLGDERVNFGFHAECVEDEEGVPQFYEGQFQYKDAANGVRFHGVLSWIEDVGVQEMSCAEFHNNYAHNAADFTLEGECLSRPGGVPGTFQVTLVDVASPGFVGDWIRVTANCTEGNQPYENQGFLAGGNIVSPGADEEA